SSAVQLVTRDVGISDVTSFPSAVLMINGNQTSCESALVDSKAGFIAASCLKYTSGTNVDDSATYELVVKAGGGAATEKYAITQIDVHPAYNADTYVNNLAMVQFDQDSKVSFQNYIGIDPDEWNDHFFIRHSLSSTTSLTWNNIIAFSSTDTPSYCEEASRAYSENPDDFLCNYAASLSVYNNTCKVPYGVVFAAVQPDDLSLVAIHSHSAVYGPSMCSKQRKLHYYTVLRNYIGWAAGVLGRSVGGFAKDADYEFKPDQEYEMEKASSDEVEGVTLFSGDRYSQDPVDPKLAQVEPEPAQASESSSESPVESTSSKSPVEAASSQSSASPSSEESSPAAAQSPSAEVQPEPADESTSSAASPLSGASSPAAVSESTSPASPPAASTSDLPNLGAGATTSGSSSPGSNLFSNAASDNSNVDDPEASGQSVISDAGSSHASTEPPSNSASGNYVDYSVNSDGDLDSSVNDQPNSVNGSNEAPAGVDSNRLVVIIVLVVGAIALVGAGIAWYVIRRKKQAIRRKNNWDQRESMQQPLPNGMRMTADLAREVNYERDTVNPRYTANHQQAVANNGWDGLSYARPPPTAQYDVRRTNNLPWTGDNHRTATDTVLEDYYGRRQS
ncbi:hypothetical protein IWW54_004956, partial [Coemansia sp. RSA 2705]